MQVKDVMTRDVEVISPDAALHDAAARMQALDVGALPVCEGERLVGMITDRDITVRATAAVNDPATAEVRQVMTSNVVTCFEDQDVKEAARLMQAQQLRRLVVLDRDHRLVGIVSLGDVATDVNDTRLVGETLDQISQPSEPQG